MLADEYQKLAARTMRHEMSDADIVRHALHGLASEVGEIHSHYQKHYQGHPMNKAELEVEVGDLLWFVAEYLTGIHASMGAVMQANIEKLQQRYPDGFSEDRSTQR